MNPCEGSAVSRRSAIAIAVLAAALLAVGQAGLWLRVEPIATWSYDLSWWPAIFLADAIVFLRTGSSILLSRPRGFLGLVVFSAAYWLLYECANFRLSNWYYVGIPPDAFTLSAGVFLSFATVLPGVLEIDALIASFSRQPEVAPSPRKLRRGLRLSLTVAGAASLILPLLFPRFAYPLIWGAAFLLLEPWLADRDERSLLSRLVAGDAKPFLRMVAAGLATGAMWEAWNWRSPAKWIYTIPLFEDGKLFEMPYLGFVGFLPFALGCHSFARALVALGWVPEWDPAVPIERVRIDRERAPSRLKLVRIARIAGVAALLFSAAAIAAVDRLTVRSTRPLLADLPGLTESEVRGLESSGIRRVEEFVEADRSDPRLSTLDAAGRERALEAAKLMTVRGMGRRGLDWLAGAGVHTVAELAAREPVELHPAVLDARMGPDPSPTLSEVRVWIVGARSRSR